MPDLPPTWWGKLERVPDSQPRAFHPLIDHCADVAACAEALLALPTLRRRLAQLGGQQDLDAGQRARLCVLAAFHDIGKFNRGFQNKALSRPAMIAGHVSEPLALLRFQGSSPPEAERLLDALDLDSLVPWFEGDAPEAALLGLLAASVAHHGRPEVPGRQAPEPRLWTAGPRDPFDGMRLLREHAERWFPDAWSSAARPLPASARFQHAFSGLVMLADWLGSDTRFFPYARAGDGDRMAFARAAAPEALRGIGLDAEAARAALGSDPLDFEALIGFPARAAQAALAALPLPAPGAITVLEAETGTGKTEAAFFHFLRLFQAGEVDGLVFALPTRTAATQIYGRLTALTARALGGAAPPVVLAVPGYLSVDGVEGRRLPHFEVLWNDDDRERMRFRGWAAEHSKRYLAGALVVGTVDQVLLSALRVGHAHLRATALLRQLLVVDEVHASDEYMTRILRAVLERQQAAGGHALLLSATLGATARTRLLAPLRPPPAPPRAAAEQVPYPVISVGSRRGETQTVAIPRPDQPRRVRLRLEGLSAEPDQIAARALDAAGRGARVLVLRNTVKDAVATQRALEALAQARGQEALLLQCGGVPSPHHARYAREDRQALDRAIEAALGKGSSRPCVAVATQTVQQSLDLDADWMLTDLCPMDVLLQRVGRLHRHLRPPPGGDGPARPPAFATPEVCVLTPSRRDLSVYLSDRSQVFGPHGIGTVYESLEVLEATWAALEARDWLETPTEARALVEACTHQDALNEAALALGERGPRHQASNAGKSSTQRALAGDNLVRWTVDFTSTEVCFPDKELERRVKTRLGEDDRLVSLPQPISSPFGEKISNFTLPGWWTRGCGPDTTFADLSISSKSLTFSFGPSTFLYDRWGLRPTAAIEGEDVADG